MKFRITITNSYTVDKEYLAYPGIQLTTVYNKVMHCNEDVVTIEFSTMEELKGYYQYCKSPLTVDFNKKDDTYDPDDIDGHIEIYDGWRE